MPAEAENLGFYSVSAAPILGLSGFARTMAINGCVISGSDPGAVPGASTRELFPELPGGGEIGSTDV
jgi:hypothetical protein